MSYHSTHICRFVDWTPEQVETLAVAKSTPDEMGKGNGAALSKGANMAESSFVLAIGRKNGVIEIARKEKGFFLGEVLFVSFVYFSLPTQAIQTAHPTGLRSIAFSGQRLLAGFLDGTIEEWDINTHTLMVCFCSSLF
jgi:hypothetical protein